MHDYSLPHPLYESVRDHLEQAMAVLPREPYAESLRALIDEALDAAIELAYRDTAHGVNLHLVPPNGPPS
jgi:hypothetical protein